MSLEISEADVMVTGGSGFLGRHLVRRLLGDGRRVRLLVRSPARLPEDLARRCVVMHGDLADPEILRAAVAEVRTVFHCAANVRTWDTPENYRTANVDGVRHLLEAIAGANPGLVRLVHVSSVDVYGFPVSPCSESSATSGGGFGYGESKLSGENLVRNFCTEMAIPFTILRPGNVIGPGSPFVERIGEALDSGVMLKIGGGRVNAGLVDVENLVDAMLWAAEAEIALGECYNVRDIGKVSWAEFIAVLRAGIKGRGLVVNLPFAMAMRLAAGTEHLWRLLAPGREPFLHRLLVCIFGRTCGHSTEKIRLHGGWSGRVGFDESMARSIRWFLEQKLPN
ncbi:MAG: NAD-dependent epimerase/dehydratase family protein [Azonexus sp.]